MVFQASLSIAADESRLARRVSPLAQQVLVLLAAAFAVGAATLFAGPDATAAVHKTDGDLVVLLRAMAALKAMVAAAMIAGVAWRLGAPAGPLRLLAYGLACAAAAAGPPLIWSMAYVGLGAVLLHAGLLAGLVLLWSDPAVGTRLSAVLAARRGEPCARADGALSVTQPKVAHE